MLEERSPWIAGRRDIRVMRNVGREHLAMLRVHRPIGLYVYVSLATCQRRHLTPSRHSGVSPNDASICNRQRADWPDTSIVYLSIYLSIHPSIHPSIGVAFRQVENRFVSFESRSITVLDVIFYSIQTAMIMSVGYYTNMNLTSRNCRNMLSAGQINRYTYNYNMNPLPPSPKFCICCRHRARIARYRILCQSSKAPTNTWSERERKL